MAARITAIRPIEWPTDDDLKTAHELSDEMEAAFGGVGAIIVFSGAAIAPDKAVRALQKKRRCWRRYPRFAFGVELAQQMLEFLLFAYDIYTDVLTMIYLSDNGHAWWTILMVVFLFIPYAVAWVGIVVGKIIPREPMVCKALLATVGKSLLAIVLPAIFDVIIPFERLLRRCLPDQMASFLKQYAALRKLSESILEGLPQSIMQSYIFFRCSDIDCNMDVEDGSVLVRSIAISIVHIIYQLLKVIIASGGCRNLRPYLSQLVKVGSGLPLDEIKTSTGAIDISAREINDAQCRLIAYALENSRAHTVNLETNEIGDGGAAALAQALRMNKNLRSLNLQDNEIESGGARKIAEALCTNEVLKVLNLGFNNIKDEGGLALAEAVACNRSLRALSLNSTECFGSAVQAAFGEACAKNAVLESLLMHGAVVPLMELRSKRAVTIPAGNFDSNHAVILGKVLGVCPKLEKLVLRDNLIGAAGAAALVAGLGQAGTLRELDLFGCGIRDEGTIALASCLSGTAALCLDDLNLGSNAISDEGGIALASAISSGPSKVRSLNVLDNDGLGSRFVQALAKALRSTSTLTSLAFNGVSLPLGALCQGGRSISLCGEGLQDMHATIISSVLHHANDRPVDLKLRSNAIGDEGATALAGALGFLCHLDLDENAIGNAGASALAVALEENATLQQLSLQSNSAIGLQCAEAFGKVLRSNHALISLGIYRCTLPVHELRSASLVDLCGQGLEEGHAIILASMLLSSTTLEKLRWGEAPLGAKGTTAFGKAVSRASALRTLDLVSSAAVDRGAADVLAKSIAANTRLTSLLLDGVDHPLKSLRSNASVQICINEENAASGVGSIHGIFTGKALEMNKRLDKLELELPRNAFGEAAAEPIAAQLQGRQGLSSLLVNGVALPFRKFKANEAVDISEKSLGNVHAPFLATIMRLSAFRELNLQENAIKPGGAAVLAKALACNASTIRTLNLNENSIQDEGCTTIADALRSNTALRKLQLNDNEVGDEGAKRLAEALLVNRSLIHLALGMNKIGQEGAAAFGKALGKNGVVQEVDLSYNKMDPGMKARLVKDHGKRIK
eukprot:g734.t1